MIQTFYATPNLAGLELIPIIFLAATIIPTILLIFAHFTSNFNLKIGLSIPALLTAAALARLMFTLTSSYIYFSLILIGYFLYIGLIFVFRNSISKKNSRRIIFLISAVYFLSITLNPSYFGVVKVVPWENDPFQGKGKIASKVVPGHRQQEANKIHIVQDVLVLENGESYSGEFNKYAKVLGQKVMLTPKNFNKRSYFEVHMQERYSFYKIKPLFKFPSKHLLTKKVNLYHKGLKLGWGVKCKKEMCK